jgi:hypothetical protein
LWTRRWTFGFHNMLGISWMAAQLAASQEGLSSVSKYIMTTELVSTPCLINPSRQSVCLYGVFLLSLLGKGSVNCIRPFIAIQRLGKHVPAATNTRDNRRSVGRIIFCAVPVLSKQRIWVCLCMSPSLPGNNLVKTFPRQRSFVWCVIFCRIKRT